MCKPAVMRYKTRPVLRLGLPNNLFDLATQARGTKPTRISQSLKHELERTYLGRFHRLVVSEGGAFTGLPRNLPRDVPPRQDSGFGFQPMLLGLADRTETSR